MSKLLAGSIHTPNRRSVASGPTLKDKRFNARSFSLWKHAINADFQHHNNPSKNFGHFLGNGVSRLFAFEIH